MRRASPCWPVGSKKNSTNNARQKTHQVNPHDREERRMTGQDVPVFVDYDGVGEVELPDRPGDQSDLLVGMLSSVAWIGLERADRPHLDR